MGKQATIETNRGNIKIKLFDTECPGTVANFEKLAGQGFYNGQKWHRVIPDFMIQGGDPNTKTGQGTPGSGGPGYNIDCEINPKLKHGKGVLSMAHTGQCKHDPRTGAKLSGPCTGGSQFFVTHTATPHLDGIHTVFGQVTEGQNVVDTIKQNDEIKSIKVETV
ncbi:MAG TPA: peptidylprolyl isomerase [Candidatus Xenobia bacterium]|jgi:peptidyl-prolyl cis-trans isomerase B (cyclophilin B)